MKVVRKTIKRPVVPAKKTTRVSMDLLPLLTTKVLAIVSGAGSAFFGFIAWLATVPPEQQTGILGTMSNGFPPAWQPTIAIWTKLISTGLGIYSVYKAAHSGPQSPPQNSPKE